MGGITDSMRSRGRWFIAVVAMSLVLVALAAAAEQGAQQQTVHVATSGLGAERIKTIPITKKVGAKTRVAMALPPEEIEPIADGARVWGGAEIEVSVTCLEPMPRCVGTIYHYSPQVRTRLALAPTNSTTDPDRLRFVSDWERLQCSQDLPHRNHHCVLVPSGHTDIADASKLPCDRCYLVLLIDAYNKHARDGNVLVIGSDDDHEIAQDKGTINAAVFNPGPGPDIRPKVKRKLSARKIPLNQTKRVVLSKRLNELRAGEQLLIDVNLRAKIGHLDYNALIQSQVILSEKAGSVKRSGIPAKIASADGLVTAQNGFNCTLGRSGHSNPCLVHKLGAVRIFRDARTMPLRDPPQGPFVPIYVNVILQALPKYGGSPRASDVVKIARGAKLSVTRYPAVYRP